MTGMQIESIKEKLICVVFKFVIIIKEQKNKSPDVITEISLNHSYLSEAKNI